MTDHEKEAHYRAALTTIRHLTATVAAATEDLATARRALALALIENGATTLEGVKLRGYRDRNGTPVLVIGGR